MRISWNWLSEWVDLSSFKTPDELADLLTQRGIEVETIERSGQGLEHVISVQILERKPHPQADRLSLCLVDKGSGDPLEVVCGAQNMKAGDKVALAQVGALLPNGLKIAQSKIRGCISNGMLCSEEELKLKESSEGILILPAETPLGVPLGKLLGRNDTLFHLKLTANRGDCLSHLGIAREVASALRSQLKIRFTSPLPLGKCPVAIHLGVGEKAPQFFGCWIEGVQVGPSPEWLVRRLESLGTRSINNVVDASNWVMHELGHPVHAYDGEQILGKKISVRYGRQGEVLPLLDGKTIQLLGSELVISDEERAVGLAGVMGGGNSEVQTHTRNLFLECAEFDPTLVRQASVRFQKKTEASHRFERGVDPAQLPFVLARFAELVIQLAGGRIVGASAEKLASRSAEGQVRTQIEFELHEIHDFLGFQRDLAPLALSQMEEIFKSLNCEVSRDQKIWRVTPPSYRLDLNLKQDLAEEVARSLGYDQIPSTIPFLTSSPTFGSSSRPALALIDQAKDLLVSEGLQETLNFSFTSASWLNRFGMKSTVKVINPLSEEHELLVPSLLPGLVRNCLDNWHHHFGSELLPIRLFELRPIFSAPGNIQTQNQKETGVTESLRLAIALSGPRLLGGLRSEQAEVDLFDLKAILEALFSTLGTKGVRLQPLSASKSGGDPLFHPGQSFEVLAGNSLAGTAGLLHPAKAKELKVKGNLWLVELDWISIAKLSRKAFQVPTFKTLPEFPGMERDFALVVKAETPVEQICQLALKVGKPLAKAAKVFDIYHGSQVAEGMTSVAVRVIFYDESRSLQESETETVSARILEAWKKELNAELRG